MNFNLDKWVGAPHWKFKKVNAFFIGNILYYWQDQKSPTGFIILEGATPVCFKNTEGSWTIKINFHDNDGRSYEFRTENQVRI